MKNTMYVPIYKWSENPNSVHNTETGTHFYSSINDLYGFEPDAVGYYEVSGILPTENEFKREHFLKSEAV